jgi:hypothetical protein
MRALGERRVGRRRAHDVGNGVFLQSGGLSVRCSVRIGKVGCAALDCGVAKRALAFHVTGDFFTAVYSET